MRSTVQELLDSLHAAATEEERRSWAVASAQALGLGGIAVSLGQELVWFSDDTSARLEDLQFVLGQGPSQLFKDEPGTREVPDLGKVLAQQWPQFTAEAEELGIAALFVWPVHIGAAQIGTMTGYRRTTGPLSAEQSAQGWLVADALAQQVLSRWPAGDECAPSSVAGTVGLHRAEVHQATGVLSEKLGVPLAEALDRLRAQAYASGRSLSDTAHAIIERELPHDSA
ncbi:ANTAR domain-containing protein [Streptomyces kunmingensis]|uniref:ANTAR domain-containing protein n=1 Tax=Streptomyces kunmingensis TaxID=68225 RepID=A0ABU6CCP8_9ACTN|nr:ANTAR domain-containing protein [Streptomyces kunmingensis]MEB3962482.1 ANTAR domain-containing protein [Streptomyces kunmingensis]